MPIGDNDLYRPDVLIVGAGHNGLTAGSYLAKAGLRVQIVESSTRSAA